MAHRFRASIRPMQRIKRDTKNPSAERRDSGHYCALLRSLPAFDRETSQMIDKNKVVPPGGHYSAALRAGDFVFTAGQTPRDLQRRVIGTDIESQTVATIENLRAALESAGASLDQVVKTTVHLASLTDFKRFDEIYARYFTVGKPVRTTVGSELNGVLVEIDAIAFVGAG